MPDHPMKTSRLLVRLDAQIEGARTPIEADCKRAERACYLARTGRIADAQAVVADLHQRYGLRPHIEVSVWVHLAEGLIGHFSDMNHSAREKILRSYSLSAAGGLTAMQALSAAWLAHMDYLRQNVSSAKQYVVEALNLSGRDDHAALARASLVVAQAMHFAGRIEPARAWYVHARGHAASEGDEMTVSALMHNMAWLRAFDLRKGVLGGHLASDDSRHALPNAESISQFDSLIGSYSLGSLVPILTAQILTTSGRYGEALKLYESNFDASLLEGMGRLHADLLADRAWCRLKVGLVDDARRDAIEARDSLDSSGLCDDRALAHGRLALLFTELGEQDYAEFHSGRARESWAEFEAVQDLLWASFGNIVHPQHVAPEYLHGANEKAPRGAL